MLETIAKELGFRLGLASIEYYQTGPADAGYDSDYNGFAEVSDSTVSITCFKDLNGDLIRGVLDFDDETETIPSDLVETIEQGDFDDEEYEGYQGNYAGDLQRWYRRSVLVIWPSWSNYAVQYTGDKGLWHALDDIKAITSAEGSEAERELVDFALSRCSQDPSSVARAVTEVALFWHDADLWTRAVKACCVTIGLKTLSEERIQLAIKHFGLEAVKAGIQEMLDKDARNAARIEFLDHFRDWIDNLPDDTPDKAGLQEWCTASTTRVLVTLKKPQKEEQAMLLSIAMNNGGIEYVKNHMLHQLVSTADSSFLREFATTVHEFPVFPNSDAKSTVVSSLLAAAISQMCFFKPTAPPSSYGRYYGYSPYNTTKPPAPEPDYLALVKVYIKTARDVQQAHLVNAIIDRILDTSELGASEAQECARKVMLPLVVSLLAQRDEDVQPGAAGSGSELPNRFVRLQQEGIRLHLDWLVNKPSGLTQADFGILIDAALAGGNVDIFVQSVWPRLETAKLDNAGLQLLIKQLLAKREKLVSHGMSVPALQANMGTLARRAVSTFSIRTVSDITSALDWCVNTNTPDLCGSIVQRCLSSATTSTPYLEQVLVPGLPQLRAWGIRHKQDMNVVVQKIVTAWTEKILGALPASNSTLANQLAALPTWTCSCASCSSARTFLTASEQRWTTLYRIGATARKHVESFLAIHARGLATWSLVRSTPQGLEIHKSDALCKLIRWRANQAKGVAILKTMSTDENELRSILGPEYHRVKAALSGRPAGQTSAPPPPPHLPAATLGSQPTSTGPRNISQQSVASSSATSVPPAKKRKHSPVDVIDLT